MIDYKKTFPEFYNPGRHPRIVDVPEMTFLMLDGEGDPNGPDFTVAVEALYAVSYAVRMSYRADPVPAGYYQYKVFPLEGVWDLVDYSKPATDKDNLKYSLMIRQPDFLTVELFERFRANTLARKGKARLTDLRLAPVTEGLCCQLLHVGPFQTEPESIARMSEFCAELGYERTSLLHREIYLSDPRRTAPDRLRTILRFKISPGYSAR